MSSLAVSSKQHQGPFPLLQAPGSTLAATPSTMAGASLSVAELVLQAAQTCPTAIALTDGRREMSYGELVGRAGSLAARLNAAGARPEVPVALFFDRSFDFIVSALAVLLSGAAYLPLDSSWPRARLEKILRDARAPLVVTRASAKIAVTGSFTRIIDLDESSTGSQVRFPAATVTPDTLAYVIYTSGSTGEPKGVEVTHANLSNLIAWHHSAFAITAADRASHLAGLGFDAAVWEIWPYLTAGATLVLAEEQVRTSAPLLRDWLVKQRITVAFVPTILAEPMLGSEWPTEASLRYLLTGGESLHGHPIPGLPFAVINNYGPTECTVVATSGLVPADGPAEIPPSIGRAIQGARIYVLDNAGRPVPRGQVGEIYIGGDCVARGYRNDPSGTAERFLPDPFGLAKGSRMYRTGDLGLILEDGQFLFRGRIDAQVQVHGHRVETDEVVCALNRHPAVMASAVVARGEACSNTLVAYLVLQPGTAPSASELRDFLSTSLPHYMIPSTLVRVCALPLNSSGKLDRAALPEPAPNNRIENGAYRAPSTPTEERMVDILADVLGADRVGVDDNFFVLGFHSLVATQVAARVSDCFGIELDLRHLFEAPTVGGLAAEVDRLLIERLNSMSDEQVSRYLAGE